MLDKSYKTLVYAVVVVSAIGIFAWKITDNNNSGTNNAQSSVIEAQSDKISYKGSAGKNALVLLKDNYKVETKKYKGLGEQVISINGIKPDKKHFWGFYVNGKLAQVGAGSYTTKDSDTITWKLEAIN